ncbi:MAG: SLC13 family permease [Gammaproteobacteria bacterium]|nr:SLC13 family permease [Gammaproteobacteria bacterium]
MATWPALPDAHGIFALSLTIVALILFSRDRIPIETSCLFILIALTFVFTIWPYTSTDEVVLNAQDFFLGFGHEALVAICGLMIIGRGLELTGALRPIAVALSRSWSKRPRLSLLIALVVSAVCSAFLNNTPIVVMMLPVLINVGLRTQTSVSSMVMPLGLVTLLGGTATTIGTSTNLLVVDIANDLGLPEMSMFDFALPAVIAGTIGLVYLWLIAPRLLPERESPMPDTSPRVFNALLHVGPNSHCVGKTLAEIDIQTEHRIKIESLLRGQGMFVALAPNVTLETGDRLLISDTPSNLKEFERLLQCHLHNVEDDDLTVIGAHPIAAERQQLAEVVVTRGSSLHHQTLKASRFFERFKLIPLAIHRAKTQLVNTGAGLAKVFLRSGDILLVQGTRNNLEDLKRNSDLLILDGTVNLPMRRKALTAIIILAAVVIAAATNFLPISVAALIGVFLMLTTRVINWQHAAASISASIIMIIVTSIALGVALMKTGGADFVAEWFVALTYGARPVMVLSGLILLMAVLTNVVSNNAAAIIGTPIAVSIAEQLQVSAEPFVLAVLFGANMSFATPVGYQTNLLLLNAGGYKFSDFLRVGLPLTLILWLAYSWLIPLFFPFD